jgi:hypothetical protein
MKERMITLLLAVGALALFYALFVPRSPGEQSVALPVSTEGRDAGYQALWRWLQAQEIQVVSFRDRYHRLGQSLPGTGNLLITTLPQQAPVREDELQQLQEWVEGGNTLLVMAALDDTPRWALGSDDFRSAIMRLTGLRFTALEQPARDASGKADNTRQSLRRSLQQILRPVSVSIVPRGPHPLFAGVEAVATGSEFPASRWKASNTDASAVLELGEAAASTEDAEPEAAVWLKSRGKGQIVVMAFASPFSNALLGKQDNARLFANIVAWSRTGAGAVLFDDAHQGLVSYYDAKAFFSDPRLHRTLLWAGLLWLLFVLGWQRLRPQADGWNPVDVTTFIKVTGGFLAGRVAPNLAGQRLCENFFNRIRQRLALPQNGLPVWDWLAAQASIPATELQQLRQLHARVLGRKRVNLIQLQNCLMKIMGSLV